LIIGQIVNQYHNFFGHNLSFGDNKYGTFEVYNIECIWKQSTGTLTILYSVKYIDKNDLPHYEKMQQ